VVTDLRQVSLLAAARLAEEAIDQAQQGLAGRINPLQVRRERGLGRLIQLPGAFQQQLGIANDVVERRAQLVPQLAVQRRPVFAGPQPRGPPETAWRSERPVGSVMVSGQIMDHALRERHEPCAQGTRARSDSIFSSSRDSSTGFVS
jgi:hypothetical protein